MERASFIFTIFFMLLGPIKIIPAFARLTRDADRAFKRNVAVKASLIATAAVAFVALAGGGLVGKYSISIEALQLAGGLVLLISALNTMFPGRQPSNAPPARPTALQMAISPLATPVIVPPAGIAAILIMVMVAPNHPGMDAVIAKSLLTVMVLDFLVMWFDGLLARAGGLLMALQVLGSVLVFIQVALGIETMLGAFRLLGVFR